MSAPSDIPHVDVSARGEGLDVILVVPTYEGEARFVLSVERDNDGDWRLFLPDTEQYEESGGIVYLGAPDS